MTPAVREIVTPEGLPLRFEIGTASDRFGAFLFDAMVIVLGTALLLIPLLAWGLLEDNAWLLAIAFIVAFAFRHGYFVWFEIRRHGSTPGKKRCA